MHSDPSCIQCGGGLVRPQADQGAGEGGRRPSRGRVSMRFVLIAISLIITEVTKITITHSQ